MPLLDPADLSADYRRSRGQGWSIAGLLPTDSIRPGREDTGFMAKQEPRAAAERSGQQEKRGKKNPWT
jgi:hypothetical protein